MSLPEGNILKRIFSSFILPKGKKKVITINMRSRLYININFMVLPGMFLNSNLLLLNSLRLLINLVHS